VSNIDIADLGLIEIAAAIAAGRVSSVEVARACLERIDQWQPSRNSFIRIDHEAALAKARQCDQQLASGDRPLGPLHGVPLAHKDLFYRAGQVSTGGSQIRRNWVAMQTSTVLSRLDAAGAIQVGTLNMSEFAASPTGHNIHYGDCRNAYNAAYMAGGSSSGSATAVAARLVYGALGSDTGGSIRVPAAANGVLGLKPTYGRVSRYGAMARFWTLDHIGVLARTAADSAFMLGIIAGADDNDSTCSRLPVPDYLARLDCDIKGVRVGVPDTSALGPMDAQVKDALDISLNTLETLGAIVVSVPLADMTPLFRIAELIGKCESASMHRKWLRERPGDYSAQVLSRTEAGYFIPATEYIDALRQRTPLTAKFLDTTMKDVDVLHLPVMSYPVPTIEESDAGASDARAMRIRSRMNALTRPINLLGLPAVSVPCGFCGNGLPLAFQLVGLPFQEGRLLQIAHAFEQVTDYHNKRPEL